MPKFPEPPTVSVLRTIEPDLRQLVQGTRLWRMYFRAGRYPSVWYEFRRFGPLSTARFDHHEPDAAGHPWAQERAILYAALQGPTCMAEVFQSTRIIDRYARSPWLVAFTTTRDLVLLDLCRTFPTRAGASMAINTGPRPRAQRWARAFYEAYEIDGVIYPSSMYGNEPAVALFECSQNALPRTPGFHRALADPALQRRLVATAREIRYDWL
jgi:RES domain